MNKNTLYLGIAIIASCNFGSIAQASFHIETAGFAKQNQYAQVASVTRRVIKKKSQQATQPAPSAVATAQAEVQAEAPKPRVSKTSRRRAF